MYGAAMQRPNLGQAKVDIQQLRQALARNPGDLDVGLMLGSALHGAGDYTGSVLALQQVLRQYPDHPQTLLLLARSLARSSNIADALKVLAHAQSVDTSNSQVWQVSAALAAQVRDWTELLRIANTWTQVFPKAIDAWQALSRAHFEESRFSEAILAFASVLELESNNPAHMTSAARLEIAAGNYPAAHRLLTAAQELAPRSGELLYALSRLYHMTGELRDAEDYCRRVIAVMPHFAPAYVTLGTLCEGRLNDAEIKVILRLFDDPSMHPEYRAMLGFTLGDAFDKKRDFDRAFRYWENANEISLDISKREGVIYRPEQFEEEYQLLQLLFSEPIAVSATVRNSLEIIPIFVVGMPRTGTTLIESILASHSEVHGAGELPTLYDIHEELMSVARDRGIPAAREYIILKANIWRQCYIAALPSINGKSRVVDKQPLNFRSVGLIRLLFPQSPIIYCQKAPMDVGLSIYRHKFSKNWPCANSLADIGHYYGVHVRICQFWEKLFPQYMYVFDHAELIRAPEIEIRRLLDVVGLDFESTCLTPHKRKRAVATFSSVQVQKPLSAAYSNRSSNYLSHLSPLYDALQNSGVAI